MSFKGLMRLDKFKKLFPIHFSGASSEDPHDFLDRFHEVLRNMGIVESNGIDFAVFRMIGSARRGWQDYEQGRPAGSPPLTWEQFSQLFFEKFIPFTLREEYCKQFECLQQGSMTPTQYETRFVDLARHALVLFPTERERVRRFIDGLTFGIRLHIAKDIGDDISFQKAIEIAKRIEMIRSQGREILSEKRPRHFGAFSGASSGGKGSLGRGHPPRPIHLVLQASHSASCSRGSYGYHLEQLAYSTPSAPISAPSLQSYHNDYSGRQGQFQFQQPQ
ncbi:uncharacterized protein [Nicotiana tomentosiformis]|uniref:uncharacterized protein n=1 Tax=Nicotiana tomentosiformis TaxID=4098 RepID=UPI00388C6D3A